MRLELDQAPVVGQGRRIAAGLGGDGRGQQLGSGERAEQQRAVVVLVDHRGGEQLFELAQDLVSQGQGLLADLGRARQLGELQAQAVVELHAVGGLDVGDDPEHGAVA